MSSYSRLPVFDVIAYFWQELQNAQILDSTDSTNDFVLLGLYLIEFILYFIY